MNQQEEIIEKIHKHDDRIGGWDTMYQYINKIYSWLENIETGKIYTVSLLVKSDNVELFTEIVKLFICEKKGNTISFIRDDFKQFRRVEN